MKTKNGKQQVWVGSSTLVSLVPVIQKSGFRVACIYETKVESFIKPLLDALKPLKLPLVGGEAVKTREEKARIEDMLLQNGFVKDTVLIACGGGALLDLVGFVAATFCRGVMLCFIPTTLLAMVDAAIGGKNGVNFGAIKNVIGTIYHPHFVMMDITALATLPDREYTSGMVEVLKHEILSGQVKRFEKLLKRDPEALIRIVKENIKIKQQMIVTEEKRHLLNFGHTIGHAIETLEQFSILHGEAVALGMKVEASIANELGFLPTADFLEICRLVDLLPLERKTIPNHAQDAWQKALCHDKKNIAGEINMVMLEGIGKPLGVKSVPLHTIISTLR